MNYESEQEYSEAMGNEAAYEAECNALADEAESVEAKNAYVSTAQNLIQNCYTIKDFPHERYQKEIEDLIDGCFYCFNPTLTVEQTANFISLMIRRNLIKGIDWVSN